MFCNLFVYQLFQPRLYLLPFSVEHTFHHGFLLIEESHIICGEFVGCLLFFGEWHSLFLFSAANIRLSCGRAVVIFLQNTPLHLSFSSNK